METKVRDVELRNGQRAEALCIQPPAPEWRDRITPFLAHKGEPFVWHIEANLDGRNDELEQRFFIAVVGEQIISEMMVVERHGLAILAHVYTDPAWRNQGATSSLMEVMTEDFAARDGVAMHLYTGFESQAYRIYHRYGFEPIVPGWGMMAWLRHPQRFESFFAPEQTDGADAVRVEQTCWTHWPLIQKLMLREEGDWLRNANLRLTGIANAEDEFVRLMSHLHAGPPTAGKVLVNKAGMTVGLATLQRYTALPSRMLQLDVYVHPTAIDYIGMLIEAIDWPAAQPILVELDSNSTERRRALKDAGFDEVGRVKSGLSHGGEDMDLVLLEL